MPLTNCRLVTRYRQFWNPDRKRSAGDRNRAVPERSGGLLAVRSPAVGEARGPLRETGFQLLDSTPGDDQ
jgi:hypothetical protein